MTAFTVYHGLGKREHEALHIMAANPVRALEAAAEALPLARTFVVYHEKKTYTLRVIDEMPLPTNLAAGAMRKWKLRA